MKQLSYRTHQRDVRIVKDRCAQNLNVSGQSYGYLSERKLAEVEEEELIIGLRRATKRVRKYWRLVHTRDVLHRCVAFGGLSRYVSNVLADLDRPP